MSRYYDEPVEVRTRATPEGPQPEQFLWRGRLHVVHAVLDSWVESGGWWTAPAARRLLQEGGEAERGDLLVQAPGGPPSGYPDSGERELWRVQATAGRGRGYGVFELGHEPDRAAWRLVRVHD